MKDTQNVKNLFPFEWAKIIGDKYGNKVAISFISQLDPEISDKPAFAPACYFDMRGAKEGIDFWIPINDYAQGVVGNTDEAIEQEIVAPHLKKIEDLVSGEALFDSEKERVEVSPTDELIDKLISTSAGKATIKMMKITTWAKKQEIITELKKQANQDPDAINRLTELLNKSNSLGI